MTPILGSDKLLTQLICNYVISNHAATDTAESFRQNLPLRFLFSHTEQTEDTTQNFFR